MSESPDKRGYASLTDALRAMASNEHSDHSIAGDAADEIERLNGMRKRLIDGTISDLAQLYGLIEEGEYDKASDYCKAAAEWYTQEIASLAALPRSIHPS